MDTVELVKLGKGGCLYKFLREMKHTWWICLTLKSTDDRSIKFATRDDEIKGTENFYNTIGYTNCCLLVFYEKSFKSSKIRCCFFCEVSNKTKDIQMAILTILVIPVLNTQNYSKMYRAVSLYLVFNR